MILFFCGKKEYELVKSFNWVSRFWNAVYLDNVEALRKLVLKGSR